jgi:hypothetical protein
MNASTGTPTPRSVSSVQYTQARLRLRGSPRYQHPGPVGWRIPRISQARSEHCADPLTVYSRTAGLLFSSVDIVQWGPREWLGATFGIETRQRENTVEAGLEMTAEALKSPENKHCTRNMKDDDDEWISTRAVELGWISMRPTTRS